MGGDRIITAVGMIILTTMLGAIFISIAMIGLINKKADEALSATLALGFFYCYQFS
jgi:predicted small integral membrane protein